MKTKYILTEEIFLKTAKEIFDYENNGNKKYIGWFFIVLSQFGVVALFKKNSIGLLLISSIFVLYWYFLRWPIRKLFLKIIFKKHKFKNKEILVESKNSDIFINSNKISGFDNKIEKDDFIILYNKYEAIYIPKV